MRLIYHPEAEAELIEAAQFYQGRVPGLGDQFLGAVDRAIAVILEAPSSWTLVEADIRRYLLPRFPYAIYYRQRADYISVLASKHQSRHPNYWRHRRSD